MTEPRTEAGRKLDAAELHDYDDKPISITAAILAIEAEAATPPALDDLYIVFDGPPSHESGRFVEVENAEGRSVRSGTWEKHPTAEGLWRLGPFARALPTGAILVLPENPTEADRLATYDSARLAGLSDAEAREEGWPALSTGAIAGLRAALRGDET